MSYPAAGVGGSLAIGSNTVANVDVWALTFKMDVKDTTAFGASGSFQTNTPTIKTWNAKVTGRTDPSDTNGQLALMNGLGSQFTVKMMVDGTHYWSGPGLLTGIVPKADVNNVNTIEYTFTGNGACTLT
jgi:hypothetical protein